MKNHWLMKFLAFLLAIFSGAAVVIGAAGVVLSEEVGYVESRYSMYSDNAVYSEAWEAARAVVGTYAQKKAGVSEEFFREYIYWDYTPLSELDFGFDYRITDNYDRTLENTRGSSSDYAYEYSDYVHVVQSHTVEMPEMTWYPEYDEFIALMEGMESTGETTVSDNGEADAPTQSPNFIYVDENGVVFPELTEGTYAYAYGYENGKVYRIDYVGTDRFEVEICFTQEQLEAICGTREEQTSPLAEQFRQHGLLTYLIIVVAGLILLALSVVWLCAMAGKKPGSEEVCPGGLNRIPLDVYAALGITVLGVLIVIPFGLMGSAVYLDAENIGLWIFAVFADGAALGLVMAMFCMAVAAQWRQGGNWWQNTLCGRLIDWLASRTRKVMHWCGSKIRSAGRLMRRAYAMMPVIWQWLLAGAGGGLVLLLTMYLAYGRYSYIRWHWFFAVLLVAEVILIIGLVCYCIYAFGVLKKGAADMAGGDLHRQVPAEYLRGPFRTFAEELNCLSEVVRDAARQQLKSERMKTELITNVSHDIKTPLTSIINYVDLLQRTEDEAERQKYLEVLERQSQQLKKLIEDLMEMSKASSGNLAMELTENDVTESVHQALGEFADRMESRNLQVMFRTPESLMAKCDGRLLWRVLSNLLSNVVKYSLPGTRVYLDVTERDGRAEISVKNISAEPLNISADELMERFVRGDASRNTEGNGLGLNIARSLMEAQGGTLELVVDGDLFKVVLTLPGCS